VKKPKVMPTGWFQIGWSAEIPSGQAVPMRYFGKEFVAFRSEAGALSVLDAYCRHLGAHMGYGGKVKKDCVICPYHAWAWDSEGRNAHIPYQDEPTKAKLTKYDVIERHGCIFMWHHPAGGAPREGWELPDLFADLTHNVANEDDYYPCYPDAIITRLGEPFHPQLIIDSYADTVHFVYTHSASVPPVLTQMEVVGNRMHTTMSNKSPDTGEFIYHSRAILGGIGLTFNLFEGPDMEFRIIFTATPVDDKTTDVRTSYFFKRDPDTPDAIPQKMLAFTKGSEVPYEQDARIWRRQNFFSNPVYAKQDIEGYTALRKWCERFYEDQNDR
jgi:3-ketosteroid 9alpha-monooxygenase subunit A